MDAEFTRRLLQGHQVELKKSLGQNFLTDPRIAERIALSCGADCSCGVLEIGPGAGALTACLAAHAGKVAALELDLRLIPVLNEILSAFPNVSIIHGDAMTADLSAIVSEHLLPLRPIVCANLPYQITTPLIRRLLASRLFESLTVMIQREAALRLSAIPGDELYNESSVLSACFASCELLFDVPPDCFTPRPHITSSVIRFTRKAPPDLPNEDILFKLVHSAFAERRKKLSSNLARSFGTPREIWELRLSALGFPPDVRGERLSADDFLHLARLTCEGM